MHTASGSRCPGQPDRPQIAGVPWGRAPPRPEEAPRAGTASASSVLVGAGCCGQVSGGSGNLASGPCSRTASSSTHGCRHLHPAPWQTLPALFSSVHLIDFVIVLFAVLNLVGGHPRFWYLNKQQEENAKLSLPEGRTIPGRAPAGREACSRNRYAFAASLASLYDDLSPADSRCCAFVRSTACSTGSSRRSRSVHLCQGTLAPRSRESTCTDSKVTQACRRAHSVLSV